MKRVLAVARMQRVNWPATLGWPWGILASSFVVNLIIFHSIGDQPDRDPSTGGLASIYMCCSSGTSRRSLTSSRSRSVWG